MSAARLTAILALAAGCWQHQERDVEERLFDMEGHLGELFDGVRAVEADDDHAFRQAMKALARTRDIPGIDDAELGSLHAAASAAKDAHGADRAAALVTVAETCASCHTRVGADEPSSDRGVEGSAAILAVGALVWHDDALWTRAGEAVDEAGATWPASASSWSERGEAVRQLLAP